MDLSSIRKRVSQAFDLIPGILLLISLAFVAIFLSSLVELKGKYPIDPTALVILFGLAIRAGVQIPNKLRAGISKSELLLVFGIVLLGASFDFGIFAHQGLTILTILIATMALGHVAIYYLGQYFSVTKTLALLLAVGTTICGGTAIAIVAPIIKAKQQEISYAISTITLWGLLAIFIYPAVGLMTGASDVAFGVFAGTAIHSTPQVVAAGYIFSDYAGTLATAIKLIRNSFIAPIALAIGFYYVRNKNLSGEQETTNIFKIFPWFLFAFFFVAGFNTVGLIPESWGALLIDAGKYLIVVGMAGVGLNTSLKNIISIGSKPLIVGFLGALIVAATSIILIHSFLPSDIGQ